MPLRSFFLLVTALFLWAMGPIFVKLFTAYYDAWTQNAFRYACAAVLLLVFARVRGHLGYRLTRAQWGKLALVALANLIMQVIYVQIYYFIYPSVASLIGRLNIVFVTVLSFLIFKDEREVIRSPRFLFGSALALAGVVFVIAVQDPQLLSRLNVAEHDFWIGIVLSLGYAFFISVYFLAIKYAVRDIPALVSFTHVGWMTASGLTGLALAFGNVSDLWRPLSPMLGVMAVSALLCIAIAHSCYYAALRDIKAVVSVSMLQAMPVLVCLFSALVYGDRLSLLQILGGAVVIFGAWLAAMAQARVPEP